MWNYFFCNFVVMWSHFWHDPLVRCPVVYSERERLLATSLLIWRGWPCWAHQRMCRILPPGMEHLIIFHMSYIIILLRCWEGWFLYVYDSFIDGLVVVVTTGAVVAKDKTTNKAVVYLSPQKIIDHVPVPCLPHFVGHYFFIKLAKVSTCTWCQTKESSDIVLSVPIVN